MEKEALDQLIERAENELDRAARYFDKSWMDAEEDGYKTDALYELLNAVKSSAAAPQQPSPAVPAEGVRTDAERLDWIESYIRRFDRSPEFHPDHHDLRTAIDRAMEVNATTFNAGKTIPATGSAGMTEPVPFPPIPLPVVVHPAVGHLFDTLAMQMYAIKYADLCVAAALSSRVELELMERVLEDAEALMAWCVKNVQKWDFPQYDMLSRSVRKARAALSSAKEQQP